MDIKIKARLNAYSRMDLDIVDNLQSTDSDKILSANQGRVLKELFDELDNRIIVLETPDVIGIMDETGTVYIKIE